MPTEAAMYRAQGKFIANLQGRIEKLLAERDAARQEAKDLATQLEQAQLRLALYEGNDDEYARAIERLWQYHMRGIESP